MPDIAATIVTMMRLRDRRAAYAVRTGGSNVDVEAIRRPPSFRARQRGADEARERLDAVAHGVVLAAEVLHEQTPEEGRDHVGRGVDVGRGREIVGARQHLGPTGPP